MTVLDKGPWHVNQWSPKTEGGRPRVVLQSDDFTYDAALEISGDFGDLETLLKYAEELAKRMNAMPGTRDHDWLKQEIRKAKGYTKDPETCDHYVYKQKFVEDTHPYTGEDISEWVTISESTNVDLDVGRFRCTQCGKTGYYTGLWKDFFEKGIPCSGSDRWFPNGPPKD